MTQIVVLCKWCEKAPIPTTRSLYCSVRCKNRNADARRVERNLDLGYLRSDRGVALVTRLTTKPIQRRSRPKAPPVRDVQSDLPPQEISVMKLNEYQKKCAGTAVFTKNNIGGQRIVYCALSLAGEAGEVANVVKKVLRDEGPEDCYYFLADQKSHLEGNVSEKMKEELGDTLWYLAMLAYECGFDLSEIAEANLQKLGARYRKTK